MGHNLFYSPAGDTMAINTVVRVGYPCYYPLIVDFDMGGVRIFGIVVKFENGHVMNM